MSEITTNFTSYFENLNDLEYVLAGLKLHNKLGSKSSAEYFKNEPASITSFFGEASFDFIYLFKEDNMIVGLIQGGSITYDPEAFCKLLASLGCTMSVTNNYYDQVGESDSFGYKGQKKLKFKTVLTAFKKLSPTFAFKFALSSNQSKLAIELLEKGANPNILLNERQAIEFVASNSYWAILRKMVKCGANVNAQSPDSLASSGIDVHYEGGMTAMHYVASFGNVELLKLLVNKGAYLDAQNARGESSLHRAVMYEEIKQIYYLVEQGADVNLKDNAGMTPFLDILGMSSYSTNEIKLFLQNGADLSVTCNIGGNALWHVSSRCPMDYDAIELIKSLGINFISPKKAYKGNAVENFEIAIAHGDIDYIKKSNLPEDPDQLAMFLIDAASTNRLSIAKLLIDAGADPMRIQSEETHDYDAQYHALAMAKESGFKEMVSLLTKHSKTQCRNEIQNHARVMAKFTEIIGYMESKKLFDYTYEADVIKAKPFLLSLKNLFTDSFFDKFTNSEYETNFLKHFYLSAVNPITTYQTNKAIKIETKKDGVFEARKETECNGDFVCYFQDINGELLIMDVILMGGLSFNRIRQLSSCSV